VAAVLEDDGDTDDWDKTNERNEKSKHGQEEEGGYSSNWR